MCERRSVALPTAEDDAAAARQRQQLSEEALLADLSMLCNGLVQLNVTPPGELVAHTQAIVDTLRASGRLAALGSAADDDDDGRSGGGGRQGRKAQASTARRARRVRARLADALARWVPASPES